LLPDLASFQRQFAATIDRPVGGAMAIYRNTVIHGAVEALAASYPVAARIVGQQMFDGIAAEFASAHPPRTPILALYGERFAEWIEQQRWAADLPYLADVARVEWLRVESLSAADCEVFSVPQDGDLAKMTLELHPAARFAWLKTPAMTIWLAHQGPILGAVEPSWTSEGALFTRPEPYASAGFRLDRPTYTLLCAIGSGGAPSLERASRHALETANAAGAFAASSARRTRS
jgi:hypothetical protein